VVDRSPSPDAALRRMPADVREPIPPGPCEMGMIAAGVALTEVMVAHRVPPEDLRRPGIAAAYRLSRPPVLAGPDSDPARFFQDCAANCDEAPSLPGSRLTVVGAGALGNWFMLAAALNGAGRMVVYDDDRTEVHNLNRQVLLTEGVNRPKAQVIVDELRKLNPEAEYEAHIRRVNAPEDIAGLGETDALVSLPDNDETRLTCEKAARDRGVLFGTAASSALGGQAIVRRPGQACLRCLGVGRRAAAEGAPCALQHDAVVGSNMVAAGLLVSQLRQALGGRSALNIRFSAEARAAGNRLRRMLSNPPCAHVSTPALTAT